MSPVVDTVTAPPAPVVPDQKTAGAGSLHVKAGAGNGWEAPQPRNRRGEAACDHSGDVAAAGYARGMCRPRTTRRNYPVPFRYLILLSVLTLAPSILLMTTCFTRVVIVMSLLRQAIGANGLPPELQVLIGLSLFITFLVMGPTWARIHAETRSSRMRIIASARRKFLSQRDRRSCVSS